RRNRRHSKQPFILEKSPVDTMADQRTMEELLRAPTKGYGEAIVVLPILAEHFELKHSLINMMTSDQFFGLEKDNPHDHIRGNLLERRTKDVLTNIENKSKEDEHVEETLTDQDLAEYTIKAPPHLVQKAKPPSQRNYVPEIFGGKAQVCPHGLPRGLNQNGKLSISGQYQIQAEGSGFGLLV
nr:reverse transcriptase domain-containing protein [Tanacetum cinerariifolium]